MIGGDEQLGRAGGLWRMDRHRADSRVPAVDSTGRDGDVISYKSVVESHSPAWPPSVLALQLQATSRMLRQPPFLDLGAPNPRPRSRPTNKCQISSISGLDSEAQRGVKKSARAGKEQKGGWRLLLFAPSRARNRCKVWCGCGEW